MLPTGLNLVRPLPSASLVLYRSYSNQSLFTTVKRKLNKIFKGSETPYVKPDHVLEEVMKAEKWQLAKITSKTLFLRDRARKNYLIHNQRIRKLEDKVTGKAFGIEGFTNKF